MNTSEVAARLVELCKAHKNFDAMKELYAENIVSAEASSETIGKAAVIQKSTDWAAAHEIHGSNTEGPFLSSEKFAVVFDFEVTPKATGKRESLREVAVYTVAMGQITREEFYYGSGDGALAR